MGISLQALNDSASKAAALARLGDTILFSSNEMAYVTESSEYENPRMKTSTKVVGGVIKSRISSGIVIQIS